MKNIEIENANKDTKSLDLIAKNTLSTYLNTQIDLTNLKPEIILNENLEAPIAINSSLGKAVYTIGETQFTTELLASHAVEKKLNIQLIFLMAGILLLIFGVFILILQYQYKKKKLKKKKIRK